MDLNTVYNYLKALESASILHRVEHFDLNLKTQENFYLGDASLLYATMGFHTSLIVGILENLVYLELKRLSGLHRHVGEFFGENNKKCCLKFSDNIFYLLFKISIVCESPQS